jgi:hypothetical protein
MKPARALVASVPVILARRTRRVVRSTSVPTAELLRAPLIKSPSQCPAPCGWPPRRGTPQGAPWQHIEAHIDGLGRELFPHVVRIRAPEAPRNLFG